MGLADGSAWEKDFGIWEKPQKTELDCLKEKITRYEKALKEINDTSGKSMVHQFSVDGHKKAVEIAEKALDEEE